ncbi:MAG: MCE family protein [Actinomycetota bacterium]|nr:MCE family protein [Actinomycetota bacterium]
MRRLRIAVSAVAVSVLLAGCGSSGFRGVYNLPLPGGADLGSHPYQVTAQFTDVLDLVPQSGVKVNNVAVGRVTKISLEPGGKLADVTMKVNGSVRLPANAVASIEQTSLLGEKYVDLASPTDQKPTGTLADGALIGNRATTQGVELEQVFGALSLLLNGGGVGQLQDITTELNKAASGNEADVRTFLASADKVIVQLNAHRDSITKALDGLDQLSATLKSNNTKIADVLDNFPPGLKVLADQRSQLVSMLHALDQLSSVTVSTLDASQANLVANLEQLQPILQNLANAGAALPQSLQVLLTYPFPDAGALTAIKGDYLNAFITTNLRTPGGTIVNAQDWPAVPAAPAGHSPATSASPSGTPTAIGPPPTLLPSTSSVAAGLSDSSITSTAPSATGSPSGTGSGSGSPTGSSSPPATGTDSSSGSSSPSATGAASPSGSSRPSTTGTPSPSDGGGH